MKSSRHPGRIAAIGVLSCLPAGASLAQDSVGLAFEATLGAGISYDEQEWRGRAELGFGLTSITRTQSLNLGFDGAIEAPGQYDDIDLVDPQVTLDYARIGPNAELELGLSARSNDAGVLVEDEVSDADALRLDTGRRERIDATGRLALGTASLVGGELDFSLRDVRYKDIEGGSLRDYVFGEAGASIRITVDPRIDLRLLAEVSDTESEGDGTDRHVQRYGAGADFEISPATRLSVDLLHTETETWDSGEEGDVERDSGPEIRLTATQDRKDGELSVAMENKITMEGRRTDASVTRTIEREPSAWNWRLGLSQGDSGDVDAILGLGYRRTARNAVFEAAYDQQVQSDAFGEESLRNQLSMRYSRTLTELSELQAGLLWRETDYFEVGAETVQQLEFSVAYNHSLTPTIDAVSRVSLSESWDTGGDEDSETTLFLGLQRRFTARP